MKNQRESPKIELFVERNTEFVISSPEEELGNLINLVRNSFEPILVYDGDKFLGSISLQNTIYNSRLAYKSRADNNLATSGPVTLNSTVNTAIRHMVNYGWLRIPIFNENYKLVGQLSAKNILKTMIVNETFLQILILKSRIGKPILLQDDAKVEDAYSMLKSKKHTQIFVIDKEGKYLGMVSKDSLIKAFNKKVESKRFDTKNGDPVRNIYVGEKIDRDDYSLKRYIKRRMFGLTAKRTESKDTLIKRLINSRFNSIVILNENIPIGILGVSDLLRSVLVKDPSGDLNLIIRGFETVKKTELQLINSLLINLSEHINKSDKINKIELSNNEVKTSEGKTNLYELMLKIDCFSGNTYLTHENSRDLIKGVRQLVAEIKKQME